MRRFLAIYRALAALAILAALAFAWPRHSAAQGDGDLVITRVDITRYPAVDIYLGARGGDPARLDPTQPVAIEESAGAVHRTPKPAIAQARPGVSVMVLVDLHRRMRGIGMPGSNRLDTARAAIVRLAQALSASSPHQSQLGVLGYHRDLVEIMPLQPLTAEPGLVESYVMPGGARQRLFDIERKQPGTRANDSADPHAQSALSLAVLSAARTLAARAAPGQQQAIVIIGSTCTDLQAKLTQRKDVTCDGVDDAIQQLRQRQPAGMLSIFGVGVGSDDPGQPQVTAADREQGFEYTANFNQIQHFVAALPGQFFRLSTADRSKAPGIWKEFAAKVVDPIDRQAGQLKISFEAAPPLGGSPPISTTVRVEIGGTTLRTAFETPRFDLLVDGTPVTTSSLSLSPGPVTLAAQYSAADRSVRSGAVRLDIAAPPAALAGTPAHGGASPANPSDAAARSSPDADWLDRLSLFFGIAAFLLAILALLYWVWMSRPSQHPVEQRSNVDYDQAGTARMDPRERSILPEPPQATTHYLEELRGPLPGTVYPIYGPVAVIGAERGKVEIFVDDEFVSPRHAILELEQGDLYVRDSGSLNGTLINEQILPPQDRVSLKPDNLLTIGRVTFRYGQAKSPTSETRASKSARGQTGRLSDPVANSSAGAPAAGVVSQP